MKRIVCNVLVASALSVTPALWAQTPGPSPAAVSEARDRYQRGVELFDEHNYSAAMVEFQRAYELTRNAVVLFNISATHELSGHFVEALDAMLLYERDAPRDVVARRRAEIDAALGRLRGRIGTVIVRFDAPGLEVRIDNLVRPASEARNGLRVSAGRHRIALSAQHFQRREEEFDIAGGTTLALSEPLVPEAAFMAVDCNVAGAEVVIDGRVVATTPTTSPLPVSEGSHHVMIRRPGFTTYETDVNSVGAGARVRAQLTWAEPIADDIAARLLVTASEPNIVVSLGGRRLNNDGREALPPGPHRLRVERDNFLADERDVNLASGQTTNLSVILAPTPAYRAQYEASVRSRRTAGLAVVGAGLAVALGGGLWFALDTNPTYQDNVAAADSANAAFDACRANNGCTTFMPLQRAAITAEDTRDNSAITRWVSLGVIGAGGLTALIGGVILLTGPSSSRFQRTALLTPVGPLRLSPGGLSLTF
ncbi:MAG: PEGA domain-containing protein [Myxococcales bacterium]|nr:PEGA domain-containing protein [Myxococcales bacterium]